MLSISSTFLSTVRLCRCTPQCISRRWLLLLLFLLLVESKRRNIYLSQGFFSIIKQQREMGDSVCGEEEDESQAGIVGD